MSFDVSKPIASKDADGGQVVKVMVTKNGDKWVTWTIEYHTMSDATFADMGKVVDAHYANHRHTNLSDKELGKWEDEFVAMIKNYREGGKGHGTGKKP